MRPQELEELANALSRHGISVCELNDDHQGVAVKLVLGAVALSDGAPDLSSAKEISSATANSGNVLVSPGMGHFTSRHPLLGNPTAASGRPIETGELVGYLVAGSLITEIRANQTGVLGRQLVTEGQLLGFADAVFELL